MIREVSSAYDCEKFEQLSTEERLLALYDQWGGKLVASTSFGIQSSVMLHLMSRHIPQVPIIFIDTGYLFPETYRYLETLKKRLKMNLHVYMPNYSAARMDALWGHASEEGKLEESRYANITKIEPMSRALEEFDAGVWISGVRRSQSSSRSKKQFIEKQNKITKVYPILDWSEKSINQYMQDHDLPVHPLKHKGYVTAGDVHNTKPLHEVSSAEETRFKGEKYECGLHIDSNNSSFVL